MRRQLFALAALTALTPALAQATASEAVDFSWTGAFLGINAGYGSGSTDWDFKSGGGGSNDHSISGGIVGIQGGYNVQLQNNLVAGIEATIEADDVGGKKNCAGNSCESKIASLSDVSGRLGVNYGESLLFGKAGLAYQNVHNSINTPGGGGNTDKGGSVGWVAGGGVEFYIDNNITTNIEYNFYDFPSDTANVGGAHIDDSDHVSVVKAGLNLKFN